MTRNEAIALFVAWLNRQVGTREGENNFNRYAAVNGITRLYGWNPQNQPWCDIFFDAGMIECFGFDLGAAMTYQFAGCAGAACAQSANYYKAKGAFFATPEVGDQVFFYSAGGINHTGGVTAVNGSTFTTVEGNSSDMVARRTYQLGNSAIAGFGRPNWALAESAGKSSGESAQTAQGPSFTETPRILRRGMSGEDVEELQKLLIKAGYDVGPDGADGAFGNNTYRAVLEYQKAAGLEVDGLAGNLTMAALRAGGARKADSASPPEDKAGTNAILGDDGIAIPETWPPRTISKGKCDGWPETQLLQSILFCRGYNVLRNGIWTEQLTAKVKEFQKETGLEADGCVGHMTWQALLKLE